MRVIVILITTDYVRNEDTLEGEDIIRIEVEDHQIEEMTKEEVIQGVETPDNRGPPDDCGPLMIVDPLMMEDPLMLEDPQEMEGHQDDLEDNDHQAHQDLLGPCTLS